MLWWYFVTRQYCYFKFLSRPRLKKKHLRIVKCFIWLIIRLFTFFPSIFLCFCDKVQDLLYPLMKSSFDFIWLNTLRSTEVKGLFVGMNVKKFQLTDVSTILTQNAFVSKECSSLDHWPSLTLFNHPDRTLSHKKGCLYIVELLLDCCWRIGNDNRKLKKQILIFQITCVMAGT